MFCPAMDLQYYLLYFKSDRQENATKKSLEFFSQTNSEKSVFKKSPKDVSVR